MASNLEEEVWGSVKDEIDLRCESMTNAEIKQANSALDNEIRIMK